MKSPVALVFTSEDGRFHQASCLGRLDAEKRRT
jgi:hypothetical protein